MKSENELLDILLKAGEIALRERQNLQLKKKSDGSPVSNGDLKVAQFLTEKIQQLYPGIPLIDEELFPLPEDQKLPEVCFVIDPIDGTKEFVTGKKDFAINVAYIAQEQARWGAINAPAHGELFWGGPQQSWKWSHGTKTALPRLKEPQNASSPILRVAQSIFHHDQQLELDLQRYWSGEYELVPMGASLKFCRLATGEIDLYLRSQSLRIWDVAAGFALLEGVGIPARGLDLKPLRFGHGTRSPGFCLSRVPLKPQV